MLLANNNKWQLHGQYNDGIEKLVLFVCYVWESAHMLRHQDQRKGWEWEKEIERED